MRVLLLALLFVQPLANDTLVVVCEAATWERNGRAALPGLEPKGLVKLFFDASGARWSTTFEVEPTMARLQLDWRAGPDGCLFEVMLDGQTLYPLRDAWRPSAKDLATDLGSRWLGAGPHLLEFIAREEAPGSALRLRELRIEALPR